ncbi:MAG: hypothetical protein RR235_07320, partial [Oscillospiraceae bacterium]
SKVNVGMPYILSYLKIIGRARRRRRQYPSLKNVPSKMTYMIYIAYILAYPVDYVNLGNKIAHILATVFHRAFACRDMLGRMCKQ